MKYKFWGICVNVIKYVVTFATKRNSNSPMAIPLLYKCIFWIFVNLFWKTFGIILLWSLCINFVSSNLYTSCYFHVSFDVMQSLTPCGITHCTLSRVYNEMFVMWMLMKIVMEYTRNYNALTLLDFKKDLTLSANPFKNDGIHCVHTNFSLFVNQAAMYSLCFVFRNIK